MDSIIATIVLLVLLTLGVPIAFALILSALVGLVGLGGIGLAWSVMGTVTVTTASSYVLVAVPLYVFMGHLVLASGIGHKAYESIYKIMDWMRGSLAMASIGACAMFAATSGSSVATAAAIGQVAIPEMEKHKYDSALACGTVAAGGTLGILIPPSIAMVVYGWLTGESIGKLLIAGIIPGIISALAYMTTIFLWITVNPRAVSAPSRSTMRERVKALPGLWGVLCLFFIAVGTIYLGVATPTEAAAFGAFAAMLIAWRQLIGGKGLLLTALTETVKTTSMLFAIMMGAMLFGTLLTMSGVITLFSNWVIGLHVHRGVVLAFSLLIWLPLGLFLDSNSILLITLPIIYPVIKSLGYDGIWFGVIIVKVIEMDLLTPPVAMNVLVIKAVVPWVPLRRIVMGTIPFMISDISMIILFVYFPQIVLWLPSQM